MSRAPNYEQALIDYQMGMKYKDIADKYGVTINTVKSWKTRYQWSKDKKSVHTKKVCAHKKVGARNKAAVAEEVNQVMENPDLTDKQRLFCLHYVRCFNATKAAIKAGYSRDTAMEQGYQLLRKPSVRDEIFCLKQNRLNREMLDEHDIFQKYMDIAFADVTDFVEFGREQVQVMTMYGPMEVENPETGEKVPLMKEVNSVRLLESTEVDGTLITEVKQGKDGASIKLADRMKALEWIAGHMGFATEEQKERVEFLKAQTARLSMEQNKDGNDGVEVVNDAPKEAGQDIRDSDTEIPTDF